MLTLATFGFNALANFALGLGVAYYLGAQEFGVYALAVAGGMVLQTLIFEWLRLAANRFYGEKQGAENPNISATLNFGTGVAAIILSIVALAIHFNGGAFGLTATVAALAPLVAIAGGLFDFRSAMARASFDARRYAIMVIVKNVLALGLMLGGAIWYCRSDIVLLGLCISALSGVLVTARFTREAGRVDAKLLRQFAAYSGPMIFSTLVFHLNMFMTRSVVAMHYGLAETGRFSLALDIGMKLVATVGSALDIYLFQLAVRAEAEQGREAANRQLSMNFYIVVSLLMPLCVGFYMILPSFQMLFIGASYQAAYASYTLHLLPGLFAFGLVFYAINPLFQIARKTWPVLIAAVANIGVAAGMLFLLPGDSGRHGADATTAGFVAAAALMALLAWRIAPVRLPWGDLAKVAAATLAMALAMHPLRTLPPGIATLAISVAAGGAVFVAMCLAMNVSGLRVRLWSRLRPAAA